MTNMTMTEETPATKRKGKQANYMKLHSWMPGRCAYAYADTPGHRADALFAHSRIPVRFKWGEMRKDGVGYVIVFCYFNSRHEEKFLECMDWLKRVMIIEGHEDYIDFCNALKLDGGERIKAQA